MKLLLLALLINNFSIVNNSVIWQNSYKTSLSQSEFISQVRRSGLIEGMEIDGNTITGKVNNIDADFKGAGYSIMLTSMYIARNYINGFIVIKFLEGSYKVTMKNMMMEYKTNDVLSRQGEKTTIEYYFLTKKKELKKSAKVRS